ncbi:MAG TPA: DMT family transporter [Terriglobia bacterium]|nr:DMT family transporter [Terriglobia bacterium]
MMLATFRTKWFWYSVLCILCWGAWALLAKLGSEEIPPNASQFLFAFGALPVAVVLLLRRRMKLERDAPGIAYSVANGVLSGIGTWAVFAAYRTQGNAAIITTVTGMYPLITVVLAVIVLRERLTRLHILGLGFAVVAFVVFSQ